MRWVYRDACQIICTPVRQVKSLHMCEMQLHGAEGIFGRHSQPGDDTQWQLNGALCCSACICCCSAKGSGGFVSYRPQDCECQREVHTSDVRPFASHLHMHKIPMLSAEFTAAIESSEACQCQ